MKKVFRSDKVKCTATGECYDELDAPPTRVGVQIQRKVVWVTACFDSDIHDVVKYFSLLNEVDGGNRWTARFGWSIHVNGKLIPNRGVPLKAYNIHQHDLCVVSLHLGNGGASNVLLPTYQHVLESEQEILMPLRPQSSEDYAGAQEYARSCRAMGMAAQRFFTHLTEVCGEDYIPLLIEDVSLLYARVMRSHDYMDVFHAVVMFVKFRNPGLFFRKENVDMIMDKFHAVFGGFWDFEAQGLEEVVAGARTGLKRFKELSESPIFKKMHKVMMYILSLGIFKKFGVTFDNLRYTKLEQEQAKKKYKPGVDFVHTIIDTIVFLLERGIQCMKTGSLDPIYHSGTTYEKWFMKATDLKRQSTLLNAPETHGFTYFGFLADLKEHIETGEAMHKHAVRIGSVDKKLVASTLSDLKLIEAHQVTKRSALQERDAPFAVLLYGGSSVGKSTLTKMMFYQYGKTFGLPTESEFKFIRNANANFWDGFTSSQWCVQLDDIAFMHPNKATNGDPTVMEMLQVVNNVPFVPDQASLEDKGRTPMKAKFVIATTNCENLNALHYFQTPLAVQRRLPFVLDVQPKAEYSRDGCMLDSSKLTSAPGCWPDYWDIIVKRVIPDGENRQGQRAKLIDVEKFTDINDFMSWFSKEAVKHEEVQKKVKTCDDFMSQIQLCTECWRATNVCICDTATINPQSGDRFVVENEAPAVADLPRDWEAMEDVNTPLRERMVRESEFVDASTAGDHVKWTWSELYWFYFAQLLLVMLDWQWCHDYIIHQLRTEWFARWLEDVMVGHPDRANYMRTRFRVLGRRSEAYFGMGRVLKRTIKVAAAASTMYLAFRSAKTVYEGGSVMDFFRKPEEETEQQQECVEEEEDTIMDFSFPKTTEAAPQPPQAQKVEVPEPGTTPQLMVHTRDLGQAPKPKGDEAENVWHKNDFELTTFDVTGQMACNQLSEEQFGDLVARNVVYFETYRKGSSGEVIRKRGRALCVRGHIYVAASHTLPRGRYKLRIVHGSAGSIGLQDIETITSSGEVLEMKDKELSFFRMRGLPPKRDITKFIAKSSANFVTNGVYILRDPSGTVSKKTVKGIKRGGALSCEDMEVFDTWRGVANPITETGDCGMPLVAFTGRGPMICGIHIAGGGNNCVSTLLTDDVVHAALAAWEEPHIESGVPMISAQGFERELTTLHHKSVMAFIPTGKCNVYGSFTGFRPGGRSAVVPTVIRDAVVKRGYKEEFGKPRLGSWEPWNLAAEDMVNPVQGLDTSILYECVEAFKSDIATKLPTEEWDEIMVYDDFTTMNGVPGVKYVDKINRKSSMGNPFKCTKKNFLVPVEPYGDVSDPMMYTDEIQERIDTMLSLYRQGKRVMPVYCGHEKDEAMKHKKIAAMANRIFTGAPGDASHITRKYLLSVVRVMQKNRFVFECGPGTNAMSLEWQAIRDHLVQFGEENMIAGDYGKFDKTMPPCVILAAFDILRWMCEKAGYSPEDLRVVQGIAEDTAFPLVDFNGDLVEFYGSNPSGHPLTVIINGLANSLYMRYCYHVTNPAREVRSFQENVALMTYGDDNVMGVNDQAKWFNHTAVQQVLADVGIRYTMADKEAESVPYIHIDEVSFLKRTWRWDEDVGAFLAPLEETSIAKCLTRVVASKTICPEQQAVEVMRSAHMEYFNYGYEKFQEKDAMLRDIVRECGLESYMAETWFPSWQQYEEGFWRRSQ